MAKGEKKHITKYTFAIIPFRFQQDLMDEDHTIREMGFWKGSDVAYNKLYSHATQFLDKSSSMWGAEEYRFDFSKGRNVTISNKCLYEANYMVKGIQHTTLMSIAKIKLFMFETKIGFIAINIDFGDDIEFDEMCAACSALKTLRETAHGSDDFYLDIKSVDAKEEHSINLRDVIKQILPSDCYLSFERKAKSSPSAIMLSSYLFDGEISEEDAAYYLQALKRAQTKEHNNVVTKERMMRPFKNMYWGFSSQGVANINYLGDYAGEDDFYLKFHNSVSKEYLLMTILLLHQEYTLLDYCQCLSQVDTDNTLEKRLEMMYEFKMKYVTSTISHLENYREFFHKLRETLDIDEMLEEVEMKLQAMHSHISQLRLAEQLAIDKENARRQKEMDDLQKKYMKEEEDRKERINAVVTVLSIALSMFGIASLVGDSVQAINILGIGRFLLFVFVVILVLVAAITAAYFAFPLLKEKARKSFEKFHENRTEDE